MAPDPPDGLLLDVTGVAHLWGGEAALLRALLDFMATAGRPARAAIAATAGCAWAMARFGNGCALVPPGVEAAVLDPLPVRALRLAREDLVLLRRLGLGSVGQLLALPRATLAARFPPLLLLRIDQALGRAEEALPWQRPPTAWFDRLAFAEPILATEDLARAILLLCRRLDERLAAAGRGARRFEIAFLRTDGEALRIRAGTALLASEPERVAGLLVAKLDGLDPGFGIEVATIRADLVEPLRPAQPDLDGGARAAEEAAWAALVDRLSNRLGGDRLWRAVPVESRVPERAVRRVPPFAPVTGQGWDPARPRPLRLLQRPEPILAVALVPDEPPSRFSWRGRLHQVLHAEGPERIAQEWWRAAADETGIDRIRDYYRIEDSEGGRFWIYRRGLYGAGRAPSWWLHGLFG